MLGVAVLAQWLMEGREAKRKLPVYQHDYGIVSAADESKIS